ncbi:OmpA family protein [Pedobacter sp. BS3]|uniref:OmpA family protein n=1 Tax=Pedobacter sp. BS3 TaxID=2567937 RepID=UPI001659842E|nr:OmpA family protein [Pedobacter sp. BS3]
MRNLSFNHISLLTVLICMISATASYGQYVYDYKKSADNYFTKGDYYSAAAYYEKYLGKDQPLQGRTAKPYVVQKETGKKAQQSSLAITYRLAECYRLLNDYPNAEKWYAEVLKTGADEYPDALYWYGVSLRANGKYAVAQQQFEKYLKSGKSQYAAQAEKELNNCRFIMQQLKRSDARLYTVSRMPAPVNAEGASYAASWNNNAWLFTSTRPDSLSGKNSNPFRNALYTAQTGEMPGKPEKLDIPAAAGAEQGVACISADGNRLYLTRWVKKEGHNLAAIYVSEKKESSWTEPVKLNEQVNVEGYSSQQPFITNDGKYLLFSSDRPGGKGKLDLWYVPLTAGGEPGEAVNFGGYVNSSEDEQSPFYQQKTGTLVFASNGRVGMGGFDLYSSKGAFDSGWQEPQNLGYPVNSSKDDLYFFNSEDRALLKDAVISSDRSSACCLELFSVSKQEKKYITGIIADSRTQQPLEGVSIQLTGNGNPGTAKRTGADGKYLFELEEFIPLQLSASKDAYRTGTLSINKPLDTEADTLYAGTLSLVLAEPSAGNPEELKVYFDFNKYQLLPETVDALDSIAALLNRERMLGLEITGYTDKTGSVKYNLKLSGERAEACKDYLLQKGISAARLQATGKGKCCTTGDDAKDRRVEFRILLLKNK